MTQFYDNDAIFGTGQLDPMQAQATAAYNRVKAQTPVEPKPKPPEPEKYTYLGTGSGILQNKFKDTNNARQGWHSYNDKTHMWEDPGQINFQETFKPYYAEFRKNLPVGLTPERELYLSQLAGQQAAARDRTYLDNRTATNITTLPFGASMRKIDGTKNIDAYLNSLNQYAMNIPENDPMQRAFVSTYRGNLVRDNLGYHSATVMPAGTQLKRIGMGFVNGLGGVVDAPYYFFTGNHITQNKEDRAADTESMMRNFNDPRQYLQPNIKNPSYTPAQQQAANRAYATQQGQIYQAAEDVAAGELAKTDAAEYVMETIGNWLTGKGLNSVLGKAKQFARTGFFQNGRNAVKVRDTLDKTRNLVEGTQKLLDNAQQAQGTAHKSVMDLWSQIQGKGNRLIHPKIRRAFNAALLQLDQAGVHTQRMANAATEAQQLVQNNTKLFTNLQRATRANKFLYNTTKLADNLAKRFVPAWTRASNMYAGAQGLSEVDAVSSETDPMRTGTATGAKFLGDMFLVQPIIPGAPKTAGPVRKVVQNALVPAATDPALRVVSDASQGKLNPTSPISPTVENIVGFFSPDTKHWISAQRRSAEDNARREQLLADPETQRLAQQMGKSVEDVAEARFTTEVEQNTMQEWKQHFNQALNSIGGMQGYSNLSPAQQTAFETQALIQMCQTTGGRIPFQLAFDPNRPVDQRAKLGQEYLKALGRSQSLAFAWDNKTGDDNTRLANLLKQDPSAVDFVNKMWDTFVIDGIQNPTEGDNQSKMLNTLMSNVTPESLQVGCQNIVAAFDDPASLLTGSGQGTIPKKLMSGISMAMTDRVVKELNDTGDSPYLTKFLAAKQQLGANTKLELGTDVINHAIEQLNTIDPKKVLGQLGDVDKFNGVVGGLLNLMTGGPDNLPKDLQDKVTALKEKWTGPITDHAISLIGKDPFKALPIVASLFAKSQGWDTVSDWLKEPIVFYGMLALVLGGGLLLGGSLLDGLFGDDKNDDQQQRDASALNRWNASQSLFNEAFGNG